ncbi:hypothetical protein D9619_012922 [Psilocybe cf. subviscida]|uniref:Fungal N-terminal domain-containing protein n=1 Tax=Psilocybe cf. subviscida TaxID=2480587 RepID=A0A8H5BJS6_9AGAR|nr:hypothetical protein D9619_012922 [Psilocybe cf. subviscida]
MDPLAVTLAAIALATAVKDITELGIKIRESFAKVPKNLLNAERVARDISEMLEDVVEFSEQNRETLENAQEFRIALQDLINTLRGFELSTLSLLQELKRCGRFSRMWTSWRRREEIEVTVQQLRDAVKKLVKRHLMRGALRTEVNTERIHHATSQIQRDITDLRVTTTTVLALGTTVSSHLSSDDIDQSILILANTSSSTCMPMLRVPAVITDEIMSKAFVKFQVGSIISIMENLRQLPIEYNVGSRLGSDSDPSFQFSIGPWKHHIITTTHLWYRAAEDLIHIRRLLEAGPLRTSIWAGAVYLAELLITLQQLGLTDEQVMIAKWSVTLRRMLISAEPDQSIHCNRLASALLSQSIIYDNINEVSLALESIEEASQIAQNFAYTKKSQALLSTIIASHSSIISKTSGGNQFAVSLSMESVKIMEDVLDVRAMGCDSHIIEDDGIHSVNPIFIQRLFSASSTCSFLSQYAEAQSYLGNHLSAERRLDEALKCMLLSITILRRMLVENHEGARYKLVLALHGLIRVCPATIIQLDY